MAGLVGEYECKIDAKGRFLFPSGLRRQLTPEANEVFMLNKGFEDCLTLYPLTEWEKISERLSKLNLFSSTINSVIGLSPIKKEPNVLTVDGINNDVILLCTKAL